MEKATTSLATQAQQFAVGEVQRMAQAIAGSGLFGIKTPDQAFALMLIAQAEGRHPATVAQEYDIIQNRPALKAQAALARFQAAGGSIRWIERTDARAAAVFAHQQGGEVEIAWDMQRATQAQLTGKDNWKKFPGQMLAARVVAEGVRACFPACLNGFYLAEEVQDFEHPQQHPKSQRQTKPAPVEVSHVEMADQTERDAILADLKAAGFVREDFAPIMGDTKLKDMTKDQLNGMAAMLQAFRDRQTNNESASAADAEVLP